MKEVKAIKFEFEVREKDAKKVIKMIDIYISPHILNKTHIYYGKCLFFKI